MTASDESFSERVLVLAPTGRDAALIVEVLEKAGVAGVPCQDVPCVSDQIGRGVGVVVVAEEALTASELPVFVEVLRGQPSWSDIPVIVSAARGELSDALARATRMLEPSGNITVLERPLRRHTLLMAVQAGLRARRRQYEVRTLLLELESRTRELLIEKEIREHCVSVLAHDLRGPLNAARLTMQLLLRSQHADERRLDLKLRVERNLDRADSMIRNLLDANRIQAGHQIPLRIDECDLVGICRDVAEELNPGGQERIVVAGEERLLGYWSAEELRRAIWNLVSNALRYGAKDEVVTIAVRSVDRIVHLSVNNRGSVISPSECAVLFEPYRRARAGREAQHKGWGLGLTLVRGCAEAHGGTVRVTSEPRTGTTFTMILPRDARSSQAKAEALDTSATDGNGAARRPDVH